MLHDRCQLHTTAACMPGKSIAKPKSSSRADISKAVYERAGVRTITSCVPHVVLELPILRDVGNTWLGLIYLIICRKEIM